MISTGVKKTKIVNWFFRRNGHAEADPRESYDLIGMFFTAIGHR